MLAQNYFAVRKNFDRSFHCKLLRSRDHPSFTLILLTCTLCCFTGILIILTMGCCCGKNDELTSTTTTEEDSSFQEFLVASRWQSTRFIGKGSFGRVYEVIDLDSKNADKVYAMKIETIHRNRYGGMTGRLPHESNVIRDIRKKGHQKHLVDIIDTGPMPPGYHSKPSQYVVMTLLGPSLVDLVELCPKQKFSPVTMAVIGKQTLEVVRMVHESGYLHRDIKPANFVVGRLSHKHEIYLIDFGLSRKFLDSNGTILAPRPKAPFRGTTPYISYNAFNYREQAPEDDLWSLFYTLVDLRTGSLPWGRISRSTLANEAKHQIIPYHWLRNVEPEYLNYYEFLTSLHYDMWPDYDYINSLFDNLLQRLHATPDTPMDWEPGGYHYSKLIKRGLKKLFNEK